MKKYFIVFASLLIFLLHGLQSKGFVAVALGVISFLVFLSVSKIIFELVMKPVKKTQKSLRQGQRVLQVLKQLSELPPEEMERVFRQPVEIRLNPGSTPIALNHAATQCLQDEARILDLKPRLQGLKYVETEDSSQSEEIKTVSPIKEISYQTGDFFTELKKIEEEVAKLPGEERKLVVFVGEKTSLQEFQLIDEIRKDIAPEGFLQRDLFPKTDVIEVSTEMFRRHRQLLLRLEELFGDEYHHYVYLYPETKSVYQFPSPQ